jgi:2,3-bisphosphoglycerate-dependent phosphoglycerate mutase
MIGKGEKMHIFLIRHGESIANVGENYVKRTPDHLVPLTENGKAMARENGKWLAEYCRKSGIDLTRARIWRSPFMRTRQTADEFNKALKITDVREDIIEIVNKNELGMDLHFFDSYSLMLEHNDEKLPDGVHFTAEGSRILGTAIAEKILTVIGK